MGNSHLWIARGFFQRGSVNALPEVILVNLVIPALMLCFKICRDSDNWYIHWYMSEHRVQLGGQESYPEFFQGIG